MARPVTIDDSTILAAAREVFLARGIKATAADVAVRAGVSEGSIFNRFKTKEALFRAAMKPELALETFYTEIGLEVGRATPEKNLVAIGDKFIALFREVIPLLMMQWSNPDKKRGLAVFAGQEKPHPVRAVLALADYLEREMKLGRVRKANAEVLARSFIGAMWHFVFLEILVVTPNADLKIGADGYVRQYVEQIWQGLEPNSASTRRPVAAKRARAS